MKNEKKANYAEQVIQTLKICLQISILSQNRDILMCYKNWSKDTMRATIQE